MLVYFVKWVADPDLTKGKGRITQSDWCFSFTVLCRSIKDASICLDYLFGVKYDGKFSLSDGVVSFYRQKIDSRNFDVQYMLMDGMKKPLFLHDCKTAIDSYHVDLGQKSVYRKNVL